MGNEASCSTTGTDTPSGSTARTGVVQTTPHAIAFMPSSPPSGQSGQPSCMEPVIPEAIAIFIDMPVVWATDRLIPTATKTARNKATSLRADKRFMAVEKMTLKYDEHKPRLRPTASRRPRLGTTVRDAGEDFSGRTDT